jgi:hypothetical protein
MGTADFMVDGVDTEHRTGCARHCRVTAAVGVAALVVGVATMVNGAELYEQVIVLQPGWNAVYLEVEPGAEDAEAVFAGVPVASAWAWVPSDETVQFIQDPAEGLEVSSGWQGYFPRPRPEAILTNLHALLGNKAYLINLDGTQPVTWRVAGRPSLRSPRWIADSFNLVGFPVDPNQPPTFGAFFADRPALEGQPVYRLDASGVWQPVGHPHSTPIRNGEAYWVYCDGNSNFDSPVEVGLEAADTLDFASSHTESTLVVRNTAVVDVDITLTQLPAPHVVPLYLLVEDNETGEDTWAELPQTYSIPTTAGQELLLDLGVKRTELTADEAEHVLLISNGLGTRRMVTVEAQRTYPLEPPAKSAESSRVWAFTEVGTPFAGLWRGQAIINSVSEAQMGGTTPVETGKDFPLRVLIHVDSAGETKLLKEVIQMWEDGTMVPDPANPGFLTTETPGRPVLLTDEDLIPSFEGLLFRDGIPVGLRLSTVAYDFPDQYLEMTGVMEAPGSLEVTITMPSDLPTNPFLHSHHPDHDNLDAQFLNFKPEAYAVTRRVKFIFSDTDPSGRNSPDWGDSAIGGTYFEEITGVHRNTIYVGGTFYLRRVAAVPELNQ